MRVIATITTSLVLLSPRERQVLRYVAHGETNKAIAYAIGITESTVKSHVANMIRTLALANRVQLTVWAIGNPECLDGLAVAKTLNLPFASRPAAITAPPDRAGITSSASLIQRAGGLS
jgi:DNA-binding CsgD family transcriptional regulator